MASTIHGLALHRKAPMAMPSRPKTMSTVSHGFALSPATCTMSWLGERTASFTAPPRKPEQLPHMWQLLLDFMVRIGTSGVQRTGWNVSPAGNVNAFHVSLSTAKCSGASFASTRNTPLTGHRKRHHTRLSSPHIRPAAIAATVEPPRISRTGPGYW